MTGSVRTPYSVYDQLSEGVYAREGADDHIG